MVALTAAKARNIVDSLVYNSGIIEAASMHKRGGKIVLGSAGIAINDGVLDVSGRAHDVRGGQIEVLGDHISLTEHSLMDASGTADEPIDPAWPNPATMRKDRSVRTEEEFLADERRGGGSIKVGGDYLGQGSTQRAKTLYVDKDALTFNDALAHGDGGRTIFWSDDTTEFNGLVFARGGRKSGHGGFLETSGKENLKTTGLGILTAQAEGYNKGTYLLDPANITIYGNFDPTSVAGLQLWLDANDLNAQADGSNVSSWSDKSGNGHNATAINGREPEYYSNQLNGNGVVRFTENNTEEMAGSLGGGNLTELSVFMLGKFAQTNQPNGDFDYLYGIGNAHNDLVSLSRTAGNYSGGADRYYSYTEGGVRLGSTLTDDYYIFSQSFGSGPPYHSLQLNGADQTVDAHNAQINVNGSYTLGRWIGSSLHYLEGDIGEVIAYDQALSADNIDLINQYQSAKWGIALDPVTGAGTEAAEAMNAVNGFGSFTTRYLERLSASADIELQASNSITLDLKGDTLTLDDDRSISLTTTNGNITDVSAGIIRTNRTGSGGNISITAGGAGNIDLNTTNLEALNGGFVNLEAGGDIDVIQTSTLNLGRIQSNGNIAITANGSNTDIRGIGGFKTQSGTIDITAGRDIDFSQIGLQSSGGDITLESGQDTIMNASINAGSGAVNVIAGRDIFFKPTNDVTTNLIGHWSLDEGAGTTTSNTITSADNNLQGGTLWSGTTPFGIAGNYSLSFDGSGDYVSLGSTSIGGRDAFTLSAWVNTTATNKYSGALSIGSSSSNRSAYIGTVAGAQLGSGNSLGGGFYGYNIGSGDTTSNQWKHVTLSYFGGVNGVVNLYIDGALSQTATHTANLATSPASIGRIGTDLAYNFSGLVDDVRIYDAGLSASDISQIYAYNPGWLSGSTSFNAGRDINLDSQVTATHSGNAIIMKADRNFINNAGLNALDASNASGRFLVYSSDPSENTLNGLSADFKRYNKTYTGYAPASVNEAGNGFLYSLAPTLTVTAGNANREYGDSNPSFGYSLTGFVDGDTIATSGAVNGSAAITSAAVAKSNVGDYNIMAGLGTLSSDLGYQFGFTNGHLKIDKANLEIIADDFSFIQGSPDTPTYTFSGFKNGENRNTSGVVGDVDLDIGNLSSLSAGTYDLDLDLSRLSALNYSFSEKMPKGKLEIKPAPVASSVDIIPNSVLQTIIDPQVQFSSPPKLNGTRTTAVSSNQNNKRETTTEEDGDVKNTEKMNSIEQNTHTETISADFIEIDQPTIDFYNLCSYNASYCE